MSAEVSPIEAIETRLAEEQRRAAEARRKAEQAEILADVVTDVVATTQSTSATVNLRTWAQTIECERLWTHVHQHYPKGSRSTFDKFLAGGSDGSYHLRNALRAVRTDLSGY
jgi:hypothetical protein